MFHLLRKLAPAAMGLIMLALPSAMVLGSSEPAQAASWNRGGSAVRSSVIRSPGQDSGSVFGSRHATDGCTTGCTPTPTPCDSCTPPPCNECQPPPPPCDKCGEDHHHHNWRSRARASANAQAAASVSVTVNANVGARAGAATQNYFYGGGGSSFYVEQGVQSIIGDLKVETIPDIVTVPYSAQRTLEKIIIIRAFCIDDKEVPHPASQVTPDREIANTYEGELYRCLAGTRLQYVMAEYKGLIDFGPGETVTCVKNSALYRSREGKLECRPQKPARDCNERSLLRRYGAGVKIIHVLIVETYTAYRTFQNGVLIAENSSSSSSTAVSTAGASTGGFESFGGVGGVAH
jgi:hypothetical protein